MYDVPPKLLVCLFKRLNSCSPALIEAAASIYGWEIPKEKCAVSLFIPLQCGMGEFSEVLKSLTKDMALAQASCWFTCSPTFLLQTDACIDWLTSGIVRLSDLLLFWVQRRQLWGTTEHYCPKILLSVTFFSP